MKPSSFITSLPLTMLSWSGVISCCCKHCQLTVTEGIPRMGACEVRPDTFGRHLHLVLEHGERPTSPHSHQRLLRTVMAFTHGMRTPGSRQTAYDPSPSSGSRSCLAHRSLYPPPIAGASRPTEQSKVSAELSQDSRARTRPDSSRRPLSSQRTCADPGGCSICGWPLLISKRDLL